MKYINKILLLVFGCYLFVTACTVNDPVDDALAAGEFVPTVYWDWQSYMAAAGDSASFTAQYYSTLGKNQISHSEVWYAIDQQVVTSAKCPLFTSQGLNFELASDSVTEDVRPMLKIKSYPHIESSFDKSKSAYQLKGTFPISFTLNSVYWGNEKEFDTEGFNKYFSEEFLNVFRDSLYTRMGAEHFKHLLTISNPRVSESEFNTYTYTELDPESGKNILYIRPEFKQHVKDLMYSIPKDSLLYDANKAYFSITYQKSYSIKACLKVIDKNNNIGVSEKKTLTVQ